MRRLRRDRAIWAFVLSIVLGAGAELGLNDGQVMAQEANSGAVQQASSGAVSLDDAITEAMAANPQIDEAKANEGKAASEVRAERSKLLPRVGVSESFTEATDPVFAFGARLRQGRFTASDFAPGALNYPAPTGDYMSSAGATWTMFDSGRTLHQVRAARGSAKAAEEQTDAAGENVAFAVVRAYYRALLADQQKIATGAAVARAEAFEKQARDRVDAGMALEADAMQAEVEVSLRKQDAEEAASNAALAYADLAAAMGDPARQMKLIAPEGTPGKIAASLEQMEAEAVAKRPDLMAEKSEMAAAADAVKASRAAFGPQISTFANVQADNPHMTGGGSSNWTVGGKIEMQVFDGGARRAETAKANAAVAAAGAAYRETAAEARMEVMRAFYARQTAERKYGIADEMLAKTAETLRTAEDRYGAGLVTVTDVLREQEQLRDMELNRAQTLFEWWIADAQLRLATGEMRAQIKGVHP